MHALRREILPPSGVEFATSLKLTKPALSADNDGKHVLQHLVVARSSYLRIFEVREEPAPLPSVDDAAAAGRRGTEAVEGEVEMDDGGEGFVNIGFVKVIILFIWKIYVLSMLQWISFPLFIFSRGCVDLLINWSEVCYPECHPNHSHPPLLTTISSTAWRSHRFGPRTNVSYC